MRSSCKFSSSQIKVFDILLETNVNYNVKHVVTKFLIVRKCICRSRFSQRIRIMIVVNNAYAVHITI